MNGFASPSDHALEHLIGAYLDGRITDSEWETLRTRLLDDRSARDSFRAMRDVHAALLGDSLTAGALLAAKDVARGKALPTLRDRLKTVALPALSACVVMGLGMAIWEWQTSAVRTSQSVGAVFSTSPLAIGQRITRQEVRLKSGLVELTFPRCEASVLIEAPARFRVLDRKTLWLESGRLTAHVQNSDDQGLRVLTPDSDVLDLGTRFAVDVVEGRGSEVHVFEGRVVAESRSAAGRGLPRDLLQGDAVRLGQSGEMADRELRRATFIHGTEMQQLAHGWTKQKFARWRTAREQMRKDPELLAFVDFEPDLNSAVGPIEGARRVQGRFPGTTAMEFLDEGDHVRFDLDATTPTLTLMAWVRLDHNATGVNSIYHTDNWRMPGQVHWMVAEGKQMRLAVFGQALDEGRGWPESSRSIIEDLGRWVHLASVYDAHAGRVRFFIDGQFDSEVRLVVSPPAVLGLAQIGNWNTHTLRNEDRRLSGRLDELVILKRTMENDEIAAWARAGSPY